MLTRIYNHFFLPRIWLARAHALARKDGHRAFRVLGANMEPTLQLGEVALYTRLDPTRVKHDDLVVVSHPDFYSGDCVPLRVAAIGGDLLTIVDGQLHLNGEPKPEPYLLGAYASSDYSRSFGPLKVPDRYVFLLGDCRDNSNDSRNLGPFPLAAIVGQVHGAHTLSSPNSKRLVR